MERLFHVGWEWSAFLTVNQSRGTGTACCLSCAWDLGPCRGGTLTRRARPAGTPGPCLGGRVPAQGGRRAHGQWDPPRAAGPRLGAEARAGPVAQSAREEVTKDPKTGLCKTFLAIFAVRHLWHACWTNRASATVEACQERETLFYGVSGVGRAGSKRSAGSWGPHGTERRHRPGCARLRRRLERRLAGNRQRRGV